MIDAVWSGRAWTGSRFKQVPETGWGRIARVLSPREVEVARLVRSGATYEGIADILGLSWHTVRTHTKNIAAAIIGGRLGVPAQHRVRMWALSRDGKRGLGS